jgi:uncharacterized protein YecE (DUF72 family)
MHIGTAAWSIPREAADAFAATGHSLQRYAGVLNCVEINSSFYRSHRQETYRKWAELTPLGFRFSVKLPRSITHDGRLRRARVPLQRFAEEVSGLGERLGVLLVQLPASLAFEPRQVRSFFRLLQELCPCPAVCEPRHASWFTPSADNVLESLEVSRAAADPARSAEAARPGGWRGPQGDGKGAVLYHRWHGSPRMYWSRYDRDWLDARARELSAWSSEADLWSIFDNTAGGAALVNALELCELTRQRQD